MAKDKKCKPNSGGFCMAHWSHVDEFDKVCELVKARLENKRLRDGIEDALLEVTADLPESETAATILHRTLNPTGIPEDPEHDEFANITGDEAMRYGWST